MPLPPIPFPLPMARRALAARRRLIDVADAALPGEVTLFYLVWGAQATKIAGALVSSGLADALGEMPKSPTALAQELGLNPDVTVRIIDAAGALRLVRLDANGRASLTRMGAPLARDHPNSISSWVSFFADPATSAAYGHLDAQLRDGAQPSGFRREFGKSMWDYFAERPEAGARFANAMRQLTAIDLKALVRAYPWPRKGVICDIAGGTGHLLAAILERRHKARGILLEAPEVIEEATAFLHSRGLADRIDCRQGDFFGTLDAHADVYTMKWIIHDWSDEACVEMLGRVRATMPAGSRLVTIDLHHERGRPNSQTPMGDIMMMAVCEGGRERCPEEVHDLMRKAGLRPGRVRHSGITMLVEGVAPQARLEHL
jgi:O-methyltransferase domain